MKYHRFIGNFDFSSPTISISQSDLIAQITNVLRLHSGNELVLVNHAGEEALVKISAIARDHISVSLIERTMNMNEPKVRATLYLAILKKENFEIAVQHAVEVGITEIVPLLTSRTVKLNLSLSRLQKIIVEAAEQSGRGLVPTCLEPVTFEEALQKASTNTTNFFFSTASEIPFSKALVRGDVLGIFVGPEGGWSPEEETLAREHHCVICSLGKLTLRAETAAIVASYVVLH